jgi:hypothetical protein
MFALSVFGRASNHAPSCRVYQCHSVCDARQTTEQGAKAHGLPLTSPFDNNHPDNDMFSPLSTGLVFFWNGNYRRRPKTESIKPLNLCTAKQTVPPAQDRHVCVLGSLQDSRSLVCCIFPPVRLSLSARLISRGTVFFSHSKSATAGL